MATLTELFTNIANAIRAKTGGTEPIIASDFPTAIAGIEAGGTFNTCTVSILNEYLPRGVSFIFVTVDGTKIIHETVSTSNLGTAMIVNDVLCNSICMIEGAFVDLSEYYFDVDGQEFYPDGSTYALIIPDSPDSTVGITVLSMGYQ